MKRVSSSTFWVVFSLSILYTGEVVVADDNNIAIKDGFFSGKSTHTGLVDGKEIIISKPKRKDKSEDFEDEDYMKEYTEGLRELSKRKHPKKLRKTADFSANKDRFSLSGDGSEEALPPKPDKVRTPAAPSVAPQKKPEYLKKYYRAPSSSASKKMDPKQWGKSALYLKQAVNQSIKSATQATQENRVIPAKTNSNRF